jgi:ribonuclease R
LAFEAYTHFTSPIRRYPDLLVHRVIKAILAKKRYQLPSLPTPGEAHARLSRRLASRVKPPENAMAKARSSHPDQTAWEAAGLHCSANERRADEASRDVEAWLKCKYMREHLGEEYSGVVTAATGFGVFVTLDALYVEGLVHITELGGEYFRFDEARQELRGERTGIRYAIGTRVQVQVSRVDLDGRKIDFRLVREGEERPLKATRERGGRESTERDAPAARRRDKKGGDKGDKAVVVSAPKSPLQSLKAAVKKAVAFKKGRKSRR